MGVAIAKVTAFAASLAFISSNANAATLAASYSFNNTLSAAESGAPALVSIDPLSQNGFETAVVNGQSQTVFRWVGDGSDSSLQAGLLLDATGLVPYNSYSVEMTFEFLTAAPFGGGWRRILDFENRQSDNGFYVSPENHLQMVEISPVASGTTLYTTPGFHHVVFTVEPNGVAQSVKGYLDGNLELSTNVTVASLDNANNPGNLLYLFADNTAANAQQEYANGRIASLKIYDGVIVPSPVPEPQSAALACAGLVTLFGRFRRAKK